MTTQTKNYEQLAEVEAVVEMWEGSKQEEKDAIDVLKTLVWLATERGNELAGNIIAKNIKTRQETTPSQNDKS